MKSKEFTEDEETRLRKLMLSSFHGQRMTREEWSWSDKLFKENEKRYAELHHQVVDEEGFREPDEGVLHVYGANISTSCKIGTIPALVNVHGKDKVKVGEAIRVRDAIPGSEWFRVKVDKINPGGYFFAAKM